MTLVKNEKKLSAWEVLRFKFPANEYVLIEEVSDASGFSRSRSLDFMLINLWQSRGLAVTGIERKSNRGDWLKELKQPEKQENHFKYCDYFYLLTDKEGVAKIEEIPENWGWYFINDKGILKTMKAAPKLNPLPIGKSLMCAMIRRAACKEKFVHVDELETRINVVAEGISRRQFDTNKNKADQYDHLKEIVEKFEEASGVKITGHWGSDKPKKIGEIVNLILNNNLSDYKESFERMERQAKGVYERISEGLKTLQSGEALPAKAG